jgi:hypothetical protein
MIDAVLANPTTIGWVVVALATTLVASIILAFILKRHRPKRLNTKYYGEKWKKLQSQLCDNKLWPLAVIDADKLLEEALKAKKYKGKSMGEKLVSAQHDITNNDLVWFGHKLRNKLVHEAEVKLRKNDVKDALLGIRSALKDLGAFNEK